MPETRKLRVFFCQSAPKGYASKDKPIVREWLDDEKLLPKQDLSLEEEVPL
jgi:hypothetical protein